jgi:TatD DNase family protein
MVPANIYDSISPTSSKSMRLPLSHSGMIPWTAAFVADIVNAEVGTTLDANDILEVSRANARLVYGV